jgi:hypothetical protein
LRGFDKGWVTQRQGVVLINETLDGSVLNFVELVEELSVLDGKVDFAVFQLLADEVLFLELDLFFGPLFGPGNGFLEVDHFVGDYFVVLELGLDRLQFFECVLGVEHVLFNLFAYFGGLFNDVPDAIRNFELVMACDFNVVTDFGYVDPGLHLIFNGLDPLHEIVLFTAL